MIPESITTSARHNEVLSGLLARLLDAVVMDSGLALRAPWNDGGVNFNLLFTNLKRPSR
jgi:hypothetical protein